MTQWYAAEHHPDRLHGHRQNDGRPPAGYPAGRRFVDMDEELAHRFGKPIAAIFAEEGEEAFRRPRRSCASSWRPSGLVIGTGGGALVNEAADGAGGDRDDRLPDRQRGRYLARLATATDRPLLAGAKTTSGAAAAYIAGRAPRSLWRHPPPDRYHGPHPRRGGRRVLAASGQHTSRPAWCSIPVHTPDGAYDLCLGDGILAHAGRLLANRGLRPGLWRSSPTT